MWWIIRFTRSASAPTSMSRAGRHGARPGCSTKRSPSAKVRLKVVKRITRCAATNVDPDTAARDLQIPQTLMRRFGYNECGIYAEVVAGGTVAIDDAIVEYQG